MADDRKMRRLDAEVENLKRRGVALPKNDTRAKLAAHEMHRMGNMGTEDRHRDLLKVRDPAAEAGHLEQNNRIIRAMGEQRRMAAMQKRSSGDAWAAVPRFYDPLEFWDLTGLPWNMADEGHRHKLHKWLRLYYATHYLVPILIDIFTRFPLVGMELKCKDNKIADFHTDLFLDQLDYPNFLVSLGREYWTVGEAFPLASFDEDLGIFEREELLNPEDVVIENFPLLGSQQLKIVPPEYLKKLVQTKTPPKEFRQLEINFPELIPYLRRNEHIPISGVLLKQVANKLTHWDDHGTPILLRGLRTLIHEEKLLASQDAIAERLYSPLILAKLGIMDLGDGQGAWVPSPEELDMFRDDIDVALSSDFRVLVHHFGLDMESVFGREQMPRLGDDFDRIERRIMQIFGVNPSLLSAGSSTQPYASSALQAEFLNQILRTFQGFLRNHFRDRAMVVAEAQEHYDYEVKGQTRIKVMEEVVEYNDDGTKRIVTKPKLLIPDMEFEVLDLRDEATERQFLQTMRAMGVPIPDSHMMVGIKTPIEDMYREYNDETMEKTIAQQEAKVKTYKALDAANLPIPPDLKAEVESVLTKGAPGAQSPGGLPSMPGGSGPGAMPPGGPAGGPGEGIVVPPPPAGLLGPGGAGGAVPGGGPPPASPVMGPAGTVPEISNERRPGMPTSPIPRMTSVNSEDGLKTSSENGNVTDRDKTTMRERDRSQQGKVVERLPRAAKEIKRYSIVEEDPELDESNNSEPPGRVQEPDREQR